MTAFLLKVLYRIGGIAQLARAPALQAGGRRFDSDYLHKKPDLRIRLFLLHLCVQLLLDLQEAVILGNSL